MERQSHESPEETERQEELYRGMGVIRHTPLPDYQQVGKYQQQKLNKA